VAEIKSRKKTIAQTADTGGAKMNNICYETRDRIADLITGILPTEERNELQKHLKQCSQCKKYRKALQKEDELLTKLFANLNAGMPVRQEKVISALNHTALPESNKIISACRRFVESWVTKGAVLAVLVVFVLVYSVITLACLSQINECIQTCT
jgi:anti-sigma factor RsiW